MNIVGFVSGIAVWNVDKSGDLPPSGDLCLEDGEPGISLDSASPTSFGVADSAAKHVLSEHHMTPQEYRAGVLAREMAAWPQPITAQTLRTRLAAYKARLCDADFELGVCAPCTNL